jgi:hypothetical protein
MSRVWGANRRGSVYATDYTVGDDPIVKFKSLKIENAVSIEGHVLSSLAEFHQVPPTEIGVIHIVRILE